MSQPVLHVQMLGEFSLHLGDTPIEGVPARAGSLLAHLILDRDRAHTRDLLAGRFWSDLADDKARKRLSNALWQLRKPFKPHGVDPLTTTAATVQFNPDLTLELDVEAFERGLDEFERNYRTNRSAVPLSDLTALVDSYRGDLLEGYYDEWIAAERSKVRSRYLSALGQLVNLNKAAGQYEEALRYARNLVANEPLAEQWQREVLRLYAMNGQPSAAERHFQAYARTLKQELKAEPSAETVQLIEQITKDAAVPPVAFPVSDEEPLGFVGRESERSILVNRVIELVDGKGGIVLIEGDPGIGKTRLAEEMAKGAEWRGVNVLVGCHRETSPMTPYEGLKEALAPATTGLRNERLLDSVSELWLQQASGVLEGLSGLVKPSARQALRPAEEPWRTSEALAQIILAQGRPRPTLLILEDIHHCDEDTMAVLDHLGDRLIEAQVLVCLTYQLHEAQKSDAIWQGLSALEAKPGSSRVVVPPLDGDEVRRLVRAELGPGRLSPTAIEQLASSTGGNPHLLVELLRSPVELLDEELFAAPVPGTPSRLEDRLLPHLTDIVSRRLDALPAEARAVIEGVSALSGPVPTAVVARAVGLDRPTVLDALEVAVELGLLVETDAGCEFAQAQTRRAVYESIPMDRRGGLHGRIVDALAVADTDTPVEQLAHHAWLAGQWRLAHRYHTRAAERAAKVNAFQTSVEHCTKADLAARSAGIDDSDRIDDLFDYEQVLDILGLRSDQESLLERLASIGELDSDAELALRIRQASLLLYTDRLRQAAQLAAESAKWATVNGHNPGELLTIVGTALARSGDLSEALVPLEDAVEELRAGGRSTVAPQLMLGAIHVSLRRFDAAQRHLEDAYDEAKATDDARAQVEALGHQAYMWSARGVAGNAESSCLAAIDKARAIGYRYGEGQNQANLATLYLEQGRAGRAFERFEAAQDVYASLGNKRGEALVGLNAAMLAHQVLGDDATAQRLAERSAATLQKLGDRRSEAVNLVTIASIERRRGQRRQARRRLGYALELTATAEDPWAETLAHLNYALVELDLGHEASAIEHLSIAETVRRQHDLRSPAAVVAAVEARARSGLGEVATARRLTDRVISTNYSGADMAHLAAWWCAEVLAELDEPEAAAEQVALASKLLSENLEGLPDAVTERAWTEVPDHRAIADAREHYYVDEIEWRVPRRDAGTGRPLRNDEFVDVVWTRSEPDDWNEETIAGRRRRRLLRLAHQAAQQGGAARVTDLANALGFSDRTIKRDLDELRSNGLDPPMRRGGREKVADS